MQREMGNRDPAVPPMGVCMRRSMLRSVILAMGVLAWAAVGQAEELKIAVVDLDQAINATEQGKKAREELTKKQKAAEAELKPLYDRGKALSDELQSKRFVLSDEALRQKQLDLAEIQSNLRAKGAELEGQFKVDYERLVGPLRDKLQGIVKDIAKADGYTLVLSKDTPGLLYSREAIDITDKVIQAFNKKG
jgi:outer membrane protein